MKTPWLPKKPSKITRRCKGCGGTGQSVFLTSIWTYVNCACNKCGGKGFV